MHLGIQVSFAVSLRSATFFSRKYSRSLPFPSLPFPPAHMCLGQRRITKSQHPVSPQTSTEHPKNPKRLSMQTSKHSLRHRLSIHTPSPLLHLWACFGFFHACGSSPIHIQATTNPLPTSPTNTTLVLLSAAKYPHAFNSAIVRLLHYFE